MSRFLKVEVSRSQYSEVYLEVPDDWDLKKWPDLPTLRRACQEAIASDEWQASGSGSIEAESVEEIDEDEAREYKPYKVGGAWPNE